MTVDQRKSIQNIIHMMGDDPGREGLEDTPERFHRAMQELLSGYSTNPEKILSKRFPIDSQKSGMVILKNHPFTSFCEHHLLPFSGRVSIGYIPVAEVVGISKLARLAECFTRRLQIQERIGEQITTTLAMHLGVCGAGCVIESLHSCMSCRGVRSPGTIVSSHLYGSFREPEVRNEFLNLARS